MSNYIYQQESYKIIGSCYDVYNELGHGFLEVVYKDALEHVFNLNQIPFQREKKYEVNFMGIVLPHRFQADFVVYDKIILEVKAVKSLADEHIAQTINYLKVSGCKLGLLINFGREEVEVKRLIL